MPALLRVLFVVVTTLSLITLPKNALTRELADTPPECASAGLPPKKSFTVTPGGATQQTHDAATLELGADAVASATTISIIPLCQEGLAALDQGMTNVTKETRRGYRFLPHMRFRNKIKVSLPYNKALIPPGLSEQDIQTFYFDEQAGSWKALERVTVDTQARTVVSLTDHFTDMINATVTVPDHPEALSFNPTSIKDIQAADPGAGINLIEAPQGNSMGDARLSYPIELPPGRNGMQPQLGISYSSSGGNGWLGTGWDLPLPSVAIDTRWGVPRYDAAHETETYLLNGAQLTPVAHRGPLQARTAEKVFHLRVEGSFQKIVRHGDTPASYWWEIVDKDGMRFFYGGDPETDGPTADATLSTNVQGGGNIFKWALREVRDRNGNRVRYSYERVTDFGLEGGQVLGVQLYPTAINYTGFNGGAGAYTVHFIRDSQLPEDQPGASYTRRPDVSIDARGGFKLVTAELLKRIKITFNGTLVRQYDLDYRQGAFQKTLLTAIAQAGEDGSVFHTHSFDYYDDPQDFASPQEWATGDDDVSAGLLGFGQASALSGALSNSVGGHLYLGFNPALPTKQGSGGGKVGFTHSETEGVLALMDVNGDNLPDKVFAQGDGFAFRLNQSGPDGTTVFGPARALPTLPALSEERSNTFSFGAEAYFVASVLANHAETFTTGAVYFSDANGDGLPDLVRDGRILFNHLDAQGVPTFSADSNSTPVPIGAGTVDSTGIIEDFEALYQQQIDAFPLQDTLRRWVAPYDGQISITGTVALVADTSPERGSYETADGVHVAIQHNGGELWSARITADDYSAKTPTGVTSIAVQAGDRLYFRVQSVLDGAYDQVAWDPTIAYLNAPTIADVNGLDPYRYRASSDFVLAGRRGIFTQLPLDGTVRLTGTLHKRGPTTDDITLLVSKNGATIFSQRLAATQTGDIPLAQDITVAKNDTIQLRVQVDSPIDVRQIEWVPDLFYIAASDPQQRIKDDQGNYLFHLQPPYDIDLYPRTSLNAPQQAWVATETGTLTVVPRLAASDPAANGVVIFTVKQPGALLAKQPISITNGVVQAVQLRLDVIAGQRLFFDYSVYDPALAAQLGNASVEVAYDDRIVVPSAVHSAERPGLYAQPYRGWAYVGYNGNRERATQPIDEALLVLPPNLGAQEYKPDPAKERAYLFYPAPAAGQWRGGDDGGWVAAGKLSSSRLGVDLIDVPRAEDFAGGRGVSRLSRTTQNAAQVGATFLSGSLSTGSSYGAVDYLDLNGDTFPDILGNGRVQYTTPTGALEATNRPVAGLGRLRESDNTAGNVGVGGSPATFRANGRGEVDTSGKGATRENMTGSQMVSLGLSASLGAGESDIEYDLLDINGDGLPDRITQHDGQLHVAFNLGYGFAPPEPWSSGRINDGASQSGSIGASLGFNGGIYDYAGGVSLSKNKSATAQTLSDLNGDGLMDLLLLGGDTLRVAFNTGNGFAAPVSWSGALAGACRDSTSIDRPGVDWDTARICDGSTGLGGGLYFTIGIGPLCLVACYLIVNPGADASQTMGRQEAALRDVDGDGYADHVASRADGRMQVARNRTGRTNLLKTIHRPLGARIDLQYQRDGNTYDQPHSRWVLASVAVFDGHPGDGVDTQVRSYRYQGGRYSRLEREFYGYAIVTEEHRDARGAVYRAVVREFLNDSFYTRGLLKRERVQDADGDRFRETESTYRLRDVATGNELANAQSTTATVFPEQIRTDERFYEGAATPGKQTYTTQRYDALGNVVAFFDAGDSGAADDVSATISYSACADTYIVGAALAITVTANGQVLRERAATIDCATGKLTQIRQLLANGDAAVTDLAYFANGNLREVTGPPNHRGQRYQLRYEYDPVVQTHVAQVTDSFGYRSTTTHNLKYGTVAATTDINNNQTSYLHDTVGRVVSITGPYEQGGNTATITFAYHPAAAVPWAITRHHDSFRSPTDPIDTVLFIDGLKRAIQTKKDATIHTGTESAPEDLMTVSGRVTFDFAGRAIEQFYPVVEPLGTPGVFNPAYDSIQPTRLTYDVLDRTLTTTLPDDTTTTFAYGFGPDRAGATQFLTAITDANGIQKRTYQDVGEQITSIQEFNTLPDGTEQVIWTSYRYDPLDQLVEVIDDRNNRTTATYDNLGRRTAISSPDAGKTELVYDLASNMVARITANLRAQGTRIAYDYTFNRLDRISYPHFANNNVRYSYGEPGASDNRAGRVTLVSDESGTAERFYGKLGEIVKEIKTVASDTQGNSPNAPEVYTTAYTYDTFGRIQTMRYPDGELLTYRYDSGGQVRQAVGQKAGYTYDYVKRLEYDKFEQRAFMEAGNNIRTRYSYRPDNRLLHNLQTGRGDGGLFQNLTYRYDKVGNVLELRNDVPVPPASQYGGPTTQSFGYDDLYRLVSATGSYQFMPDKTNRYRLSLQYDTIHNITAKQQAQEIVQPSGIAIPQHKTSYDWRYRYDGAQPHAPTHIDERTYSYDANGNQTGWTHDQNGTRRTIVWDEENRIQSIFDNGHEKTYTYNDAGERVIKRGPQGETAYVNQFFTMRNREVGTKHVYVGATRIASKLMKQDKPGSNPGGQNPVEKDQYFFHPDHLGSSNYITDANGKLYEHLEYFPFGEIWVEESSNTQRTPYLFTAKELDEETGLYYYGARYYDPRTSVWQSADPILGAYLDSAGIYQTAHLALYTYGFNSPLRFSDPDGRDNWDRVWGAAKLVSGLVEVSAGVGIGTATSWTGVGAVAGAAVALHGADVAAAGLRQIISGQTESTLTSQGLQAAGLSRNQAELVDVGISVVTSAGAMKAAQSVSATEAAGAAAAPAVNRAAIIRANAASGAAREVQATATLQASNPGATILRQRNLLDASGRRLIDPLTREGRRLDFVTVQNGQVTSITEVTSLTAPKAAQLAKTQRIRALGDVFIRDPGTKQLIRIPQNVPETLMRLP